MINGCVICSSGIEPQTLHNHLWLYPRVLIVNISAFTGHQNFSRKIVLVYSSLQQKTGGENNIQRLRSVKWAKTCLRKNLFISISKFRERRKEKCEERKMHQRTSGESRLAWPSWVNRSFETAVFSGSEIAGSGLRPRRNNDSRRHNF